MNKKLKFRVWDHINKEYLKELSPLYWHVPYSFTGEDIEGEANLYNLSDLINKEYLVEQYTGTKDSNGKELYEGDIVNVTFIGVGNYICKIKCDSMEFGFYVLPESPISFPTKIRGIPLELTIIGNVLQNPELLTEAVNPNKLENVTTYEKQYNKNR